MEMDSKIWSQLPEELLERVLSLLPLTTILSLKSTCKRFHALLLSPSFLTLVGSSHRSASSSALLILSHPQFSRRMLPLYSYFSDAWRTAPPPSTPATLLSSTSGLLLFSLPLSSSLLVSNPLTASTRLLLSPTHNPTTATIVSLPSPNPHGYNIFLPSSSSSNSNSIFLYSSQSDSWSQHPGAPVNSTEGVAFAGILYFTTPEPISILGFNLSNGKWDNIQSEALPADLAFARLVAAAAKLYLVGGVGADGIARSLRVWELVEGRWEEVGRLPELMCRKFVSVCYHNYAHVYCLWHQGLLCVCCTTWPEVLFFKIVRGTWHWLPRCPLLQDKWSCGFRFFSFVPDLYALV